MQTKSLLESTVNYAALASLFQKENSKKNEKKALHPRKNLPDMTGTRHELQERCAAKSSVPMSIVSVLPQSRGPDNPWHVLHSAFPARSPRLQCHGVGATGKAVHSPPPLDRARSLGHDKQGMGGGCRDGRG